MLKKIISGGQTGVDQAALDVAIRLGISIGGWCPLGRWSEDGAIDSKYPLQECTSPDPAVRTGLNVRDSDGTLILVPEAPEAPKAGAKSLDSISPGTSLAHDEANRLGKPVLVCDPTEIASRQSVLDWIEREQIRTLNIAGPRASEHPTMYALSVRFLFAALGLGHAIQSDEPRDQDGKEERTHEGLRDGK